VPPASLSALIIAQGAIKPTTWTMFLAGSIVAIVLATLLTNIIPRLYPWGSETEGIANSS
jgi:fumarate reductase subunit D